LTNWTSSADESWGDIVAEGSRRVYRDSLRSRGLTSPVFPALTMGFFSSLLAWFQGLFFTKSAEVSIVGLQVGVSVFWRICAYPSRRHQARPRSSTCSHQANGARMSCRRLRLILEKVRYNTGRNVCYLNSGTVRKGNVTFKIWDVAGTFACYLIGPLAYTNPPLRSAKV
jgi:hypothetical protein